MQPFDRLFWKRKFNRVRRFHVESFEGQAITVGHHHGNVALIIIEFVPDCSAELLKACVQHDLEEGVTGDLPATLKWALGDEAHDEVNKLEERVRNKYKIEYALTEKEERLLKAADFLDGVWTCLDQRMAGNRAIDCAFECYAVYESKNPWMLEVSDKMKQLWMEIRGAYYRLQHGGPCPQIQLAEAHAFWREDADKL